MNPLLLILLLLSAGAAQAASLPGETPECFNDTSKVRCPEWLAGQGTASTFTVLSQGNLLWMKDQPKIGEVTCLDMKAMRPVNCPEPYPEGQASRDLSIVQGPPTHRYTTALDRALEICRTPEHSAFGIGASGKRGYGYVWPECYDIEARWTEVHKAEIEAKDEADRKFVEQVAKEKP